MSYRHTGSPAAAARRRVHLPVRVCLATVAAGCALSIGPGANAATPRAATFLPHGDGWSGSRLGNGKFNHNSYIINSPSNSNDIQHIRNVNVGGNTVTPAAVCRKRVHHCKIIQRLTVVDP